MKIKTTELTALVTKSIRGASNNKMLPITTLMCITAKSNTLTLETTDSVNYLYISSTIDDSESFYAVVNADMFTKLISKITSENTSLAVEDSVLYVTGNGTYKLAMQLDEDGQILKFPDPLNTRQITTARDTTVLVEDARLAYNKCSSSLSEEISEVPVSEYYFSDKVITTDSVRLSSINKNVFDTKIVLNARFIELLCQANELELDVHFLTDSILVSSATYSIFCTKLADVEAYPKVEGLLESDMSFDGQCCVSKSVLLPILDRLALFVSPLSQNKIHLFFDTNGITLHNDTSSGVEFIKYNSSESFTPFECDLDIELFMAQLKTFTSDAITLYYANTTAIKMMQDNVTHILCLSE